MLKQETITQESVEGIYVISLDYKHRFTMPLAWRNNFSNNEELVMMYTGSFAILIKKSTLEKNNTESSSIEPELITHTTKVDKAGRVVIPINFIRAYEIITEESIAMFGKNNHIEIYFQKKQYIVRKMRALRAAVQFQVNLLTKEN